MSTKLIRLTMIGRYMHQGFLYLKTRAYRVDADTAERMCMLEFRDMPVFKVVSQNYIDNSEDKITIVNLAGRQVEDEVEDELDEDDLDLVDEDEIPPVTEKPETNKTVVKKKAAIRSKAAKAKAAAAKKAAADKKATTEETPDDVTEV